MMPYEIDDGHYEEVLMLEALDRYEYFVERIVENGELWTLRSAEGFVTIEDDELPAIPFWPHPRYAEARISDSWEDCELFRIELEPFMAKWLPGMREEGRRTVVFPAQEASAFMEPGKLLRDIKEERREHNTID